MEAKGYSQRWKMRLPELKQSKRCLTTEDTERGEAEGEGREGSHKCVTMAATSRYLTDRKYVARKPLFSAERHASILKKTHPQKLTEKGKQQSVDQSGHPDMKFLPRPKEELIPESFSLLHSDISSPSASKEDLSSPLCVSELQSQLHHKESTTFGSSFSISGSAQQSLSSSILEVHRLSHPLRPQLTSTVLYPTYTSRFSKLSQTRLRQESREGRGGEENKLCSLGVLSKGVPKSPYQANYWACAIPKALPPSPDRYSTRWNPNKEYQALLDYTYPLRPGQVMSEQDSSKRLQGDFTLQTDLNLQDSGIALDHLCSSSSLSGLDISVNRREQSQERSTLGPGHRSPDLQSFTRCSDAPPSRSPLSFTDPMGSSLDCLDCSKDRGGANLFKSDGHDYQHHTLPSSTSAFIHSTSVLPQSRFVCGEVDEEFRPLPEQLKELQLLSSQVREVTAQLTRPVTTSWDSLEPGTTSIHSSVALTEKQEPEDDEEEGAKVQELQEDKQDKNEGKKSSREQRSTPLTAADHRDSESMRSSSEAWAGPAGRGLDQSSLKELGPLVEQLCGFSLTDSERNSLEDQEQNDSLMQHIQAFCSHLRLLIQQLRAVSEKMERLTAPTVDIDSVKSSLAEYQSFQREVSNHQPLASCVLHTGQLLLGCINSTSPFLRDTLLLIESQTGVLQTHTEHFFSSILSAMDSLTQPSPVQQCREEDPVVVQASTF